MQSTVAKLLRSHSYYHSVEFSGHIIRIILAMIARILDLKFDVKKLLRPDCMYWMNFFAIDRPTS